MNQTNVRVRYLDLEASNADAETVSALVGIVSQVQSGKPLPVVTAASIDTVIEAAEPLALPAPAPKARKPRAAKAAAAPKSHSRRPEGGRATNAAQIIYTHVGKGGKVDKNKLAAAIYGGTEAKQLTKVNNMLSYLVRTGKLTKSAEGTYARVS